MLPFLHNRQASQLIVSQVGTAFEVLLQNIDNIKLTSNIIKKCCSTRLKLQFSNKTYMCVRHQCRENATKLVTLMQVARRKEQLNFSAGL